MAQPERFSVIAIPLSRPQIVDFLLPPTPEPEGVCLQIMGQRPTRQAEAGWIARLEAANRPTVVDLLAVDNPYNYLIKSYTDRLVPVEFLAEPDFLTKNLGGWAPIYLDVAGLPAVWPDDPLLNQAVVLREYGRTIQYFGADPHQVTSRLEEEVDRDSVTIASALSRLHRLRRQMETERTTYIERIYAELATGRNFETGNQPPIPPILLFDELLGRLVELELSRRAAVAADKQVRATKIKAWQRSQAERTGLRLILKGEYIMGRHRRSTVLIAPALGVVIKQPAPEPFHEIKLGAKTFKTKEENWPYTTQAGQLVTPRGRLRLIIEENLVPRLNQAQRHKVRFSTLLGLTVEPFVEGKTVQELVLADPGQMTPQLYELFVLHQQMCELIGGENGDWHSANFIMRKKKGEVVHVDWGAVRPLSQEELTPAGRLKRLNQIQNIAYSFHDEGLADRVLELHTELMADKARLDQIWRRAQSLVEI